MKRILVAGIGNVFHGDDGFGVEVAQQLARRAQPAGVDVVDFGIRGIDLFYALQDDYPAVVLVDAAQTGAAPGTISLIEPEIGDDRNVTPDSIIFGHGLDPASALRLAVTLGKPGARVLLVACEPLELGGEDGAMGLSSPVSAAVQRAVETIEELTRDILSGA
jgi:hydrogenase maturation protease